MTDDDINEAIDTLSRACNVENRQSVIQALRRLVNSGGETASVSAQNRKEEASDSEVKRDAARYQILEPCEGAWLDCEKATYDREDGAFKRIIKSEISTQRIKELWKQHGNDGVTPYEFARAIEKEVK